MPGEFVSVMHIVMFCHVTRSDSVDVIMEIVLPELFSSILAFV